MICYIGGKNRMAEWISGYIPNNIETYVELFGGAFWVYIKGNVYTKPNLKTVIYNDFNRYMVNLIECCRRYDEFYDVVKNVIPQDKVLFDRYRDELFNKIDVTSIDIPDFQLAMKYAYIVTQVFSGYDPITGSYMDLRGKYDSKFVALGHRLENINIKMRMNEITTCENLDFEDIVKKYDSKTTFFYADPPYWKKEDYYSLHDFDADDHFRLSTVLKNIQGKFALSYYHFDNLDGWFNKNDYTWKYRNFVKSAGAVDGKNQNKSEELLIMNYKLKSINDFI